MAPLLIILDRPQALTPALQQAVLLHPDGEVAAAFFATEPTFRAPVHPADSPLEEAIHGVIFLGRVAGLPPTQELSVRLGDGSVLTAPSRMSRSGMPQPGTGGGTRPQAPPVEPMPTTSIALSGPIEWLSYAADAGILMVQQVNRRTIQLVDLERKRIAATINRPSVGLLATAGGRRILLYEPESRTFRMLDAASGDEIRSFTLPLTHEVIALAMGSQCDDRALLVAKNEGQPVGYFLDLESGSIDGRWHRIPSGQVYGPRVTSDDRLLAIQSGNARMALHGDGRWYRLPGSHHGPSTAWDSGSSLVSTQGSVIPLDPTHLLHYEYERQHGRTSFTISKGGQAVLAPTATPGLLLGIDQSGMMKLHLADNPEVAFELGGIAGFTRNHFGDFMSSASAGAANVGEQGPIALRQRFVIDLARKRLAYAGIDPKIIEIGDLDLQATVDKHPAQILSPVHPLIHLVPRGKPTDIPLPMITRTGASLDFVIEGDNADCTISRAGVLTATMPPNGDARVVRVRVTSDHGASCYSQLLLIPARVDHGRIIPETRLEEQEPGDVYLPEPGYLQEIAFAGRRWAVATTFDPPRLVLYDLLEERMVATHHLPGNPTHLSAGPKHCAVRLAGQDDFSLWSLPDFKALGNIAATSPAGPLQDVCLPRDLPDRLALLFSDPSATTPAELRICSLPDLQVIATANPERALAVVASPDGSQFATWRERQILHWRLTKDCCEFANSYTTGAFDIHPSPSITNTGDLIISTGSTRSELWCIASGRVRLVTPRRALLSPSTSEAVAVTITSTMGSGENLDPQHSLKLSLISQLDGAVISPWGSVPHYRQGTRTYDVVPKPMHQIIPTRGQKTAARPFAHFVAEHGRGWVLPSASGIVIRRSIGSADRATLVFATVPPTSYIPGETWTYAPRLADATGKAATWSLRDAPQGMAIDARTGVVTWRPGIEERSRQIPSVIATTDDGEGTQSMQLTVARRSLDDATTWTIPGNILVLPHGKVRLSRQTGNDAMLIDGTRVYPISPATGCPERVIEVGTAVQSVTSRDEVILVLSGTQIITFDRRAGRETRRYDLGQINPYSILAVPERRQTWVMLHDHRLAQGLRNRIAMLDERTGKLTVLDRVFGSFAASSPDGRVLYTAISEFFRNDLGHVVDQWGQVFAIRNENNISLLLRYEISGGRVTLTNVNDQPGINGQMLSVNADGSAVGFAAAAGYPGSTAGPAAAAFSGRDATTPIGVYPTDTHPRGILFHPALPLVAAWNDRTLRLYSQDGKTLLHDNLLKGSGCAQVVNAVFSDDGRSLIVQASDQVDKPSNWYLLTIPLPLKADEIALLDRRAPRRAEIKDAEAPPTADTIGAPTARTPATSGPILVEGARKPLLSDFTALRGGTAADMTPKRIAESYGSSVVLITHANGSGTGFFLGSRGHIMTCAHVLGTASELTVHHRNDKGETIQSPGTVIARDDRRDIALIHIETNRAKAVVFTARDQVAMGERVVAIGNPGIGETVLSNSMTEGIVSNPDRQVDAVRWLQISAAVNPGNSGGPLFDEKGNVIGMVVARTDLEGAGFAIHRAELIDFLKKLTAP